MKPLDEAVQNGEDISCSQVVDTDKHGSECALVKQDGVCYTSITNVKPINVAAQNGEDISCSQVVDTDKHGSECAPVKQDGTSYTSITNVKPLDEAAQNGEDISSQVVDTDNLGVNVLLSNKMTPAIPQLQM